MSSKLFGETSPEDYPTEYEPKIHYVINNGNAILCDTKNAKAGTEDKESVTCKRCLTLLERGEEIEAKGHIDLTYSISVESPKITRSGKKLLQAWLNAIPDDVKLDYKTDYNQGGLIVTASWLTKKEMLPDERIS